MNRAAFITYSFYFSDCSWITRNTEPSHLTHRRCESFEIGEILD